MADLLLTAGPASDATMIINSDRRIPRVFMVNSANDRSAKRKHGMSEKVTITPRKQKNCPHMTDHDWMLTGMILVSGRCKRGFYQRAVCSR